jgi:V/A-type H+/Na+-transporting ATPase subunit I
MIVKMSRVFIATRMADRDRLLAFLDKLNLVHLEPVEPEKSIADEKTLSAIRDISRAIQILSPIKPTRRIHFQNPVEAARETIELRKTIMEHQQRLLDLHRRISELEIWGNVRLSQFEILRQNGIEIRFFIIPKVHFKDIEAECAEIITALPEKKILTAIIDRRKQVKVPEGARPLSLPSQDRASVLAEAKKSDRELKQSFDRLAKLAGMTQAMRKEYNRLSGEITYVKAQRSGVNRGIIFALQGWIPAEKADRIESQLIKENLYAAVQTTRVKADDMPPTLIHYPAWVKPIKALFDLLGTLPGYREIDLSPFFMLAMPLFAAMLISDAGYGLLIFLTGFLFYKKITDATNKFLAQIMIIFGLATLAWGILIGNYFGITLEMMAQFGGLARTNENGILPDYDSLWEIGGFYGKTTAIMLRAGIFWREDPEAARFLLMKIAIVIGSLHLILARIRKMVKLFPDQRILAELGWIIVIVNILALIWYLMFIGVDRTPATIWWILGAGLIIAASFHNLQKSIIKRLLLGLSSSMLPLLNTFTDTMSYIRLFAVGLSSYYISSAFNTMAMQTAEAATWLSAVPILIIGHGLNIAIVTIAIFAHGVRLNMLEFSNHAGVQWHGYAYRPFTTKKETRFGENLS